jgi:hypothetical protein
MLPVVRNVADFALTQLYFNPMVGSYIARQYRNKILTAGAFSLHKLGNPVIDLFAFYRWQPYKTVHPFRR